MTEDSSFQICLQELGIISHYKLPIRIIIRNNKNQGMVRQCQELFYGITEIMITNEKNLKSSLKQYLKFSNPMIFNCLVIDKENCFNSGTSNAAMSDIKCQQREIYLLK